MEKWIWLVEQESSDPSRDAEVHKWLETVHVPGMLDVPEIKRATLYANVGPELDALNVVRGSQGGSAVNPPESGWSKGQARYVAVYDIETDDIKKTWIGIRQWIEEQHRKNPGFRHPLLRVVRRSVWRLDSPK